jgi:hypothetical protein
MYYVNVHIGEQLVHGFMAELENLQAVAPFNGSVDSASGMAKVSFEAGTYLLQTIYFLCL